MKNTAIIFFFDNGISAIWKSHNGTDGFRYHVEFQKEGRKVKGYAVRCTPSIKHSIRLAKEI